MRLTQTSIPPVRFRVVLIVLDRRGISGLQVIQASWLDFDQTVIARVERLLVVRLMDRSLAGAGAVDRHGEMDARSESQRRMIELNRWKSESVLRKGGDLRSGERGGAPKVLNNPGDDKQSSRIISLGLLASFPPIVQLLRTGSQLRHGNINH